MALAVGTVSGDPAPGVTVGRAGFLLSAAVPSSGVATGGSSSCSADVLPVGALLGAEAKPWASTLSASSGTSRMAATGSDEIQARRTRAPEIYLP